MIISKIKMKECPKCGTVYTDKTLSFCLSDGTALSEDIRESKTEELRASDPATNYKSNQPTEVLRPAYPTDETLVRSSSKSTSNGVSRGWVFATFGLLAVMVVGAFVVWTIITREPSGELSNINVNTGNLEKTGAGVLVETKTPEKDQGYRVVGVKSTDVLYIRPAPGNLKSFVGKIPPGAAGIVITGGARKIGKSMWVPISYRGMRGWVNRRFLKK